MAILVLGVILWIATHSFPLYAPGARDAIRARIGEGPWKGLFALVSVGVIWIIVIGWRAAGDAPVQVWNPPAFLTHVNNLLVLVAFLFLGAGHAKANLRRLVRHPQFTAVKIWAVAHLLVNGDLRSIVLFGGLLLWAGMSVGLANRRDGAWVRPPATPRRNDVIHAVVSVAAFVVVALSHQWLFGVRPFPG
jgi:uncharacterized membrane protein